MFSDLSFTIHSSLNWVSKNKLITDWLIYSKSFCPYVFICKVGIYKWSQEPHWKINYISWRKPRSTSDIIMIWGTVNDLFPPKHFVLGTLVKWSRVKIKSFYITKMNVTLYVSFVNFCAHAFHCRFKNHYERGTSFDWQVIFSFYKLVMQI